MANKDIEFPLLKIDKAIEYSTLLEKEFKGYANIKDAFAKAISYKSANNGAFINAISDLRKFGLIEKRGDIQITELGRNIAYATGERKTEFIQQAIRNVPIFSKLIDVAKRDIDSINLEAQLLNLGFNQADALKSEKKIRRLYKSLVPYITNMPTNKELDINIGYPAETQQTLPDKAIRPQMQYSSKDVYSATLQSDGISLIVPRDLNKIKKLQFLIDSLKEELESEKVKSKDSE